MGKTIGISDLFLLQNFDDQNFIKIKICGRAKVVFNLGIDFFSKANILIVLLPSIIRFLNHIQSIISDILALGPRSSSLFLCTCNLQRGHPSLSPLNLQIGRVLGVSKKMFLHCAQLVGQWGIWSLAMIADIENLLRSNSSISPQFFGDFFLDLPPSNTP